MKTPKALIISLGISTVMLIVSLFFIDYSNPEIFQFLNVFTFLTLTIMNIILIKDFNNKNKLSK